MFDFRSQPASSHDRMNLSVKNIIPAQPVCKAAVLLIKFHVDSSNAAMSLYQIIECNYHILTPEVHQAVRVICNDLSIFVVNSSPNFLSF